MTLFLSLVISIAATFLGFWLARKYDVFVYNRQEKAILVIFLHEFSLLLRRAKFYYSLKLLSGGVSFATLFEASDSSTYVKLAEVSKNSSVIDRILKLKSDFSRVIMYANMASKAAAQSQILKASGNVEGANEKWMEATTAQDLAIIFFMGDLEANGTFRRNHYKSFVENIECIIDYIDTLNSPPTFLLYTLNLMPIMRKEKESLDNFVLQHRKELKHIEEVLELLREKEKLQLNL